MFQGSWLDEVTGRFVPLALLGAPHNGGNSVVSCATDISAVAQNFVCSGNMEISTSKS